ncbi:MAG: hypothetical protein AABX01_04110 [Candidatus Micrarchaeota archaeon]
MTNVTIAVPNDLKSRLDGYPEINWSEEARKAWREKLRLLAILDLLTAKSTATDKDIEELSKKIKKGIADSYEKKA